MLCFLGRTSLACSGGKGGPCLLQDVLKHTTHLLTCYHSCVTAKMANPHTKVLSLLFTLLANTALSPECRSIMKKVMRENQATAELEITTGHKSLAMKSNFF